MLLTLCDPHGLQRTRLSCRPPSPGVCSDSWPLSLWCYLTISPSVIPFSFCLQSFPASASFLMSRLFTSGDPGHARCWMQQNTTLSWNGWGWRQTKTHSDTATSYLSSVIRKDTVTFMSIITKRKRVCDSQIMCYEKLRQNSITCDLPQNR